MDSCSLLLELYGRILPLTKDAIGDLEPERLVETPGPGRNTIAWLIWHTARVQDHHISELVDQEQIWITEDWAPRFALSPDPNNTGYGHGADEMQSVRPERPEVLIGYLEAVDRRTRTLLHQLDPADLDQIVDRRWDPPVTMGVRLVSIADDSLQHLGQAAYVRGLLGY